MIVRLFGVMIMLGLMASTSTAAPKSATDKVVDTFMELDTNHSDSVSYAEYKAMVDQRARSRFKTMDSNRDNQVSEGEYREFWRKTKAKWYRLKR